MDARQCLHKPTSSPQFRGVLRRFAFLTFVSAAALPSTVHAVGTAAGTSITSTATVDYSIGGAPTSAASNTSTIAVAELVNETIALQSPTVSVAPGAANEALLFLVTNTGNSAETFSFVGDSVLVGDNFDPTPASPFIYFDTDASGDLSPADVPYVAGSGDPTLAA